MKGRAADCRVMVTEDKPFFYNRPVGAWRTNCVRRRLRPRRLGGLAIAVRETFSSADTVRACAWAALGLRCSIHNSAVVSMLGRGGRCLVFPVSLIIGAGIRRGAREKLWWEFLP